MRELLAALLLTTAFAAKAEELPRVIVLDLQTDASTKDSAKFVTEAILTELARTRRYEVIGSSDVQALIGLERQRELLGCSDQSSSCLAEISGALGAQYLVTGALGKLGKEQRLDLKLIDTKSSKVLVREGGAVTEDTLSEQTHKAIQAILSALPRGTSPEVVGEVRGQSGASAPLAPKLLTAVGVAVAAVGISYGVTTATAFDPTDKPFSQALLEQRDAQTKSTIGYLAGSLGIAAAVAGAVWWASTPDSPAVAIVPLADGAAVSFALRFGGAR